jgi:two-component system sensor histidine kinase/response regulator
MDRTLHDMRNDLAVAIGTVHAFSDGKLQPDAGRLAILLRALESIERGIDAVRPAESALFALDKEQLVAAVIEGSPYAKVLVDAGGRIVLVNAQSEALFGYARAELIDASIELLVPARPIGGGRELFGRRKDAAEFPIEISLIPIATGGETFTLAAISDITERRRSEQQQLVHAGIQRHADELEGLNAELAIASRFKTEFVATMSHELRTPLGAIIGAAELLATSDLDERSRMLARTIFEASEALFALINSVLDFSKIEAGKIDLHASAFDLAAVIASATDVVAQLAREKSVVLETQIDARIPALFGDHDRLHQILLNLLANAVKFTSGGRVAVRARLLDAGVSDVRIGIEVQDSGIGIAADVIPLLFEPFAQADRSASRKFGGTGLGLSISKRLIALMSGEIGVVSAPGFGSTFWLELPFACAPARIAAALTATPSLAASGTVLVAEDNEHLQDVLRLQFEAIGVSATFVLDGRAALAALHERSYAMVFMDCQMPELDGIATTKQIRLDERAHGGHVPIAAMTASAFPEDRAACTAAGMDDYLAKPVKLADLRAVVERWTLR